MAWKQAGQRPRLCTRDKSGEGNKEREENLKVLVKMKADSFLPRDWRLKRERETNWVDA